MPAIPAYAQLKTGPDIAGDDALTWHGITLYGVVDVGFQYDTHGAEFSDYRPAASANIVQKDSRESVFGLTPSNMGQSRVGLQGLEPLAGGWSAVFRVETFFNPQSGELADSIKSLVVNNGRTPATQTTNLDGSSAGQALQTAYLGAASKEFGTITFGRQLTLLAEGTIKYDPNFDASAFGLIGASNTYSGGGSSEDKRLDSALKYVVNLGDYVHLGAFYKFNGASGSASTALQANLGGGFAGASIDAYYSKVNDAISASALTAAQVADLPKLGFSVSNSVAATVSDNTAYALRGLRAHPLCRSENPAQRRLHGHRRLRSRLREQHGVRRCEGRSALLAGRALHRDSAPRPDRGLLRRASGRLRHGHRGGLLDGPIQRLQRRTRDLRLERGLFFQQAFRRLCGRPVQRGQQRSRQWLRLQHDEHQSHDRHPIEVLMNFLNAVAGFGVGVAVGMTGVGGGSLMTPILVLLFGYAPASAVGTDLWFAAITKISGGTLHHARGTVDWQVLARLFAGSVPASILTLLWMNLTRSHATEKGLIVHALGAVLLVTAIAMLARKPIQRLATRMNARTATALLRAQTPLTVLAGALLGFIVPLTSVGAGALGTVMLLYIYPLRMTPRRLVGTDIVHAIPLALIAGIGHLLMGNVQSLLLLNLLMGSIPGILLGTLIATRSSELFLRIVIAAILLLVSLKLLLS
jgi:uncharacterized membrane protein YfcA/predicted porin